MLNTQRESFCKLLVLLLLVLSACSAVSHGQTSSLETYPKNCIFPDRGDMIYNEDSSMIAITHSDFSRGWGDLRTNNIDADPLFIRYPSDGGDGWGDDPGTIHARVADLPNYP